MSGRTRTHNHPLRGTPEEELAKEVRPGDVVSVLLDPAGPGTEEYRISHGHLVDLKVVSINRAYKCFDGEFYIEDIEALFEWITLMDGVNDGSQIRQRKVIPDISLHCLEEFVERGPTPLSQRVEYVISELAEEVAILKFKDREPGDVSEDEFKEFEDPVRDFLTREIERIINE